MKKKRIIIITILILLVVLLLAVLMAVSISKKNEKVEREAVSVQTTTEVEKEINTAMDDAVKEKLKNMSEQKRVEYYASEFIKAIEARNITKAYSKLNSDFKNNYFQTADSFSEYVKKYFPKEMSIKYENMERLGDIYVLVVSVKDILSKNPNDFQFYIVVKENGFNDYELSFSVDSPMKNYNK